MYARIIQGRVAELFGEVPTLGQAECALIVEVGPDVQAGWAWSPDGCTPQPDFTPDPVTVAHSYLLADAQSVDELREALAVILGL